MLLDRRVEGVIVIADWLVMDIKLLADWTRKQVPTVIVGREIDIDTVSTVSVDNEAGARAALESLHRLGHREMAFIRGPKTLASSGQRWKGIRSFAQAAGIALDQRRIAELPESLDPNSSFEAGAAFTPELLSRRTPLSWLIAFYDMTALGPPR